MKKILALPVLNSPVKLGQLCAFIIQCLHGTQYFV
jgi:hypothetical protein